MSVTLARRALQVVPPDDLRVLKSQDPAALKQKVKEDPADIAFLAIRQLGGSASTQELKRTLLADKVLTSSHWSSFWKEAKSAMDGDDRFDLSQAFRQTYRIRTGNEEGALALPKIEPRRGIRPNLNLIRRFLEQHPDETARAARMYAGILQRWGRQERTNAEERMAVQLQLYRWNKKVDEEFTEALRGMLDAAVEASVFADLEDQKLIVETGLAHRDLWKKTVYFALSSRYPEVRELALKRLREDPETGRGLLNALIQDPSERPVAALTVMNLTVGGRGDEREPFAPHVWDAAIGAATLTETTNRDPLRKQALALLGQNSTLVERLLQTQPGELQLDRIGVLVRRWRSSERFLQPLLNVLRRAGHETLVKDMRSERMARTNQMLLTQPEHEHVYEGHLMTRRTFDRLKGEIERLNYELKTTVAQAIAKARALGDLSENAEYDAARMKQADYAERIASMAARLKQAKVIDEMKIPEGQVAPGTEVELEDTRTGEGRTYWILGEGDDVIGPEVISYTSPLGRGLLGRKTGDTVRFPGEETIQEFTVRAIRRRLPQSIGAGGTENPMSEGSPGPEVS